MSQDRTDLFDELCISASSTLIANLFWASLVTSSCSATSACSFTSSLSLLVWLVMPLTSLAIFLSENTADNLLLDRLTSTGRLATPARPSINLN